MDEWVRAALGTVTERWHSPTGLLVALGAVGVSMVVLFAGIDFSSVSASEWVLIVLALLLIGLAWWRTYIPRVRRGRVGFAVALGLEKSEDARQLREDFVHTLRALLDQSKFRHRFEFVEMSPAQADHIVDETTARSVARRGNFHFFLFGRARQRTLPQGPAHVIDIRGIVRHASISAEAQKQFGDDFGAVLPQRMIVGPRGDMLVCEFAARHVDAARGTSLGPPPLCQTIFHSLSSCCLTPNCALGPSLNRPRAPRSPCY